MDIVYLLVPLSVVLVFAIAVMFWWSVHSGQFDDLERQGQAVLDDIDTPAASAPAAPQPAPASPQPPAAAPTDPARPADPAGPAA